MKRNYRIAALVAVLFAAAAQDLFAAVITFQFSGEVTAMGGGVRPAPWDSVQIGDSWTLAYSFDSNDLDIESDPNVGVYTQPLPSYTLNMGPASSSDLPVRDIVVTDAPADFYQVAIYDLFSSLNIYMELSDPAGDALTSDDLPTTLNLGSFPNRALFVQDNTSPIWAIQASVDTFVVPEPFALGVLAPWLFALRRPSRR